MSPALPPPKYNLFFKMLQVSTEKRDSIACLGMFSQTMGGCQRVESADVDGLAPWRPSCAWEDSSEVTVKAAVVSRGLSQTEMDRPLGTPLKRLAKILQRFRRAYILF